MSGHSKWANTKHRKTVQDTKRGKVFTKIIREIVTVARLGGSDLVSNPRLRKAVDKALSNNMTRDTLNRAIARSMINHENQNVKNIIYEGYGPGGTALLVQCLSENRNRTVAEVRHAFKKYGGSLGTEGSVSYLFKKRGLISFRHSDEDTIMEIALEAGAEDIACSDGVINIYVPWEALYTVYNALKEAGLKADHIETSIIPLIEVSLESETAQKLLYLTKMLADCNDVQKVYHNGKIPNEAIFDIVL